MTFRVGRRVAEPEERHGQGGAANADTDRKEAESSGGERRRRV